MHDNVFDWLQKLAHVVTTFRFFRSSLLWQRSDSFSISNWLVLYIFYFRGPKSDKMYKYTGHWLRCVTHRPRKCMLLEMIISITVATGYISAALVTQPSVRFSDVSEMENDEVSSKIQQKIKESGAMAAVSFFSGLWFSLHSILTSDVYITHFDEWVFFQFKDILHKINNYFCFRTPNKESEWKWIRNHTKAVCFLARRYLHHSSLIPWFDFSCGILILSIVRFFIQTSSKDFPCAITTLSNPYYTNIAFLLALRI